ncbi:pantoate--beta-alanine ligase [Paludibacter jiangxiensis]|uniref:Pantothenate synthetase n=1 Tax=Paludibacter jiangxiensis TaxID=681398 RepID=A0A161LDL6_9BACT|nr:pantoate--beta-alanine ligase [Paludibacter jiangxiensis]GAT62077.1 pantoate--beta-alanine ligase [Paludibacter jiangxiensis]
MKVFSTIADLKAEIAAQKAAGKTIGLVPTMGALHAGHASLVKKCAAENDVTVVSVFVNPTQFNDKNDLKNYPRTLEKDTELLQSVGCNLIFAPSEDEIYPEPDTRVFDFAPLDKVMEGKYRPGHFNGVAQIVSKLFDIVTPDKAYFGEKDFQQLAIIREMVKQLGLPLEIIACPIVREADGLALSSRNARLTDSQRKKAVTISKVLFESRNFAPSKSIAELTDWVIDNVNKESELRVEYFEIVDGNTLQAVSDWNQTDYIVGCITVFCGEVRLIDNIRYK